MGLKGRQLQREAGMAQAEQETFQRAGWGPAQWVALMALILNGFAFFAVNYWIYTARWTFIARNSDHYHRPPTISRAISDPVVGEPFALWMTISGLCLVAGVALLVLLYLRLAWWLRPPFGYLWVGLWMLIPAIAVLQGIASLGIYWLGHYRFPDANEMHMVGSYSFFEAQALVVAFFTLVNLAMRRDSDNLTRLDAAMLIDPRWVRVRIIAGLVSLSLVVAYFALFKLKDIYIYETAPVLYLAYVSVEPMAISSFLLVLALAHVDLFRRPRN